MVEGLSNLSVDVNRLNEQVYEALRDEILKGNLKPGQRLPINTIADHLGISATPVRDAVLHLNTDGLVEIIPRRGTFVSVLKRKNIQEVFDARRIIECAAAERATKPQEDVVEQMKKLVNEIASLREDERFRDYRRYIDLDVKFHHCLVELLENKLVTRIYEQLHWPLQVVRMLSYADYHRASGTVSEHQAILQGLVKKDVLEAEVAIRDHLDHAEADLLRRMQLQR